MRSSCCPHLGRIKRNEVAYKAELKQEKKIQVCVEMFVFIFMNGVDIDSMHARNKGYVVTKGLYLVQFPTSVVKKYRKRQ